ncbi:hypothetical protein NC651_012827 [Populus alba x Populus x berolinensis]|nr:hypothetical protein NC651_012827 [Populus alba x Populus x berolinensis]
MYAPSRHDGRDPWITSHSVGGSSSTGAKLSLSTYLGSTDGRSGGSMKLLMTSSSTLNIIVGWFGSTTRLSFAGDFLAVDDFVAGGKAVVDDAGREVPLVVGLVIELRVFSSILTDDTMRGGGGRDRNDGVVVTADLGMAIAKVPVRSSEA